MERIGAIFANGQFSIPNYQRDYAWGKENFNDLWSDLQEALDSKNEGHFLGTIIVAPNKNNTEDSKRLDIIDGQQRITTIFMLLYALAQKSQHKDRHKIKYLLDEKNTFNLKVTEKNETFFKNLLTHVENDTLSSSFRKGADTQGQKNLYDVCEIILDTLKPMGQNEIEQHIKGLLDMNLMWLMESDSGRAIRTFQSVNDRGVRLTLLEKLKSLLIYYSNSYCNGGENGLDEMINNTFGDIFEVFAKINEHQYISGTVIGKQSSTDREESIFRYHSGSREFDNIGLIGHYERSSEDTFKELKKKLKDLIKNSNKYEILAVFIKEYMQDLKRFCENFLELLDEIASNPYVFKFFLLENVNPHFYNSVVRLKMGGKLDNELLELITKADVLLLKTAGWQSPAYNLYKHCFEEKEKFKAELINACKGRPEPAIKSLSLNPTGSKAAFHYVFFEQNCSNMDIDSLKNLIGNNKTLKQEQEHIIPQSILNKDVKEAEDEAKKLGFESFDELKKTFLNSYGNLLSLEGTYNNEAKAKEFYGKKEVYKESVIPFVKNFFKDEFDIETRDFKEFKSKVKERNDEFEKWLNEFFKEFLS